MESSREKEYWSPFAKVYDPIKIGSIDGTDSEPHDKAVIRALKADYRPNRHVKGRPEKTVFISRISLKTSKETIQETFAKYGKIRRFRFVRDFVTGFPKGYAFVEYETEEAAEIAYRKANKLVIDGKAIFVDFECERLLKGWVPRRLGGGFGGKKESGQLRFGGRDRPFRKPLVPNIISASSSRSSSRSRESDRKRRTSPKKTSTDRDTSDRKRRNRSP